MAYPQNIIIMITKEVIDEIYRKYRRHPKKAEELHLQILSDVFGGMDILRVDDDDVVFLPAKPTEPERKIGIKRINGVIEFDRHVAIVLHASIIFIAKETGDVTIHIKDMPLTMFDRICMKFGI